jgi:hypothetical protein
MQAYQHVTGNSYANFVSVNTGIIRCFLHEDGDEKKREINSSYLRIRNLSSSIIEKQSFQ